MPRRPNRSRRLATALNWPAGIALTSWRYMWRTTPMHRREVAGSPREDAPPPLPPDADRTELQLPEAGVGPLFHRRYGTRIRNPRLSPEALISRLGADLDQAAPTEFASFQKVLGAEDRLAVGDEIVVRMPGPWDGPVRVVEVTPVSFRLATLDGHLEAGQIDFRAEADSDHLLFTIESWARSGDRLSDVLYQRLRMAKEIQLHMWTSFLERVAEISGGRMTGGLDIYTRRVDGPLAGEREHLEDPPVRRELDRLRERRVNFDAHDAGRLTPAHGWHVDDCRHPLPREAPGEPEAGGSWEVARTLISHYDVADPAIVRGTYDPEAPLEGRDMLLVLRFWGLRFRVGVRVGEVYDEAREVDGRPVRVYGWNYRTLEGHLEEGQLDYQVVKWLESGEVEFRIHAVSRRAQIVNPVVRLGFRLFARRKQLQFYRHAGERIARLTAAELKDPSGDERQADRYPPASIRRSPVGSGG